MSVLRLPPAEQVLEGPYDLQTPEAPTLRGSCLRFFSWFTASSLASGLQDNARRSSGIPQVTEDLVIPEKPTFTPPSLFDPEQRNGDWSLSGGNEMAVVKEIFGKIPETAPRHHPSARDYVKAYTSGDLTPSTVAEKIIEVVENTPDLHYFISFDAASVRQEAKASTERYASKSPLSLLDGVPFCVKDQMHAVDYSTTCGSKFLNIGVDDLHPEAPIVTSLRNLGCMFLGKTNMYEIGLGINGLNLHHGTPKNPWNKDAYPGGSTSGGAAIVASGLCPLSIGGDGGGSIRLPASFCGIFGMKLTYDRETPQRAVPLGYTVMSYGPLTRNIEDAIVLYALLSKKPSSKDDTIPATYLPTLKASAKPLEGLKFGVYNEWFDDSEEEVKEICRSALTAIERLGGRVISINIPELELLRVAHAICIMAEARHVMNPYCRDPKTWKSMGPDVRMNLTAGRYTSASEYLQAQCIRTRMGIHFKRVLSEVDCIVTPTVAIPPPMIHPQARKSGELDLTQLSVMMRYAPAPNLIGMPAISIPVGFDGKGRPIGLQLVARHWQEALLLKIGYHLDRDLHEDASEIKRPETFFDVLKTEES